jgi:signal transduction histidine kinase
VIHNTIRHSKASSLKIELKMENGNLLVLTEDNGIGFNYAAESGEQAGLGMRSLLSRTEVLEGSMYVDSKIDKGTKFRFEIPI